jgi:hypothetical protein
LQEIEERNEELSEENDHLKHRLDKCVLLLKTQQVLLDQHRQTNTSISSNSRSFIPSISSSSSSVLNPGSSPFKGHLDRAISHRRPPRPPLKSEEEPEFSIEDREETIEDVERQRPFSNIQYNLNANEYMFRPNRGREEEKLEEESIDDIQEREEEEGLDISIDNNMDMDIVVTGSMDSSTEDIANDDNVDNSVESLVQPSNSHWKELQSVEDSFDLIQDYYDISTVVDIHSEVQDR